MQVPVFPEIWKLGIPILGVPIFKQQLTLDYDLERACKRLAQFVSGWKLLAFMTSSIQPLSHRSTRTEQA